MRKTDMRGAPERRDLASRFEVRAVSTGELSLSGYASVFDSPYDIAGGATKGGWSEVVDQHAFDQTLKSNPDLHLLINHEGMPLARTRSKTLTLSTDSHGLKVSASLDRQDPDVQRLERKMARGDMDEMSFAFRTIRDQWAEDDTERRLLEVSLDKGDVSVVNFGANPATHSELQRALRAFRAADETTLRRVGGSGLVAARRALSTRALDPEDVNVLTQALGWFTAVDNIVDSVTTTDPEMSGVLTAIDLIVDEAQEALSVYLGVPSPDPDEIVSPDVRSRLKKSCTMTVAEARLLDPR